MFAPVFLVITQPFIWLILLDANDRWANEYLTEGLIMLVIAWQAWVAVEVWNFAMSHSAAPADDGEQEVEG